MANRSATPAVALVLALFAVYCLTLLTHAAPGERLSAGEAHVLLTTESIVHDGDLDVSNQYARNAYRGWYDQALEPTAKRDAAGRIAEPHGIGLPLLLAPAFALGGVTLAKLLLALLTACAFGCAAALARRIVPEPWATAAALVGGLSPPAVAAATSIRPEAAAAAALAGAAVLALRVRDDPRPVTAFWGALLVATVPWLGLSAAAPAIVVSLALAHWLRRRRRGLAGFVALEVVLTSAVVFITINDRLYGGLTPYASRASADPALGDASVARRLARIGELLGELVLWAPATLLALGTLWLLWRSRRDRLTALAEERIHVEVTAAFLALVCGAQLLTAALLAPSIDGPWFSTRFLVPALPFGAALAAWAMRRYPLAGRVLGGLTVALTVWLLVAAAGGDATLAPPHGLGLPAL